VVDRGFVEHQRDDLRVVESVIRERRAAGVSLETAQREPDARLPYPLEWLAHAFTRGFEQLSHD
jgi:hypothetical protein